MRPPDQLPEPKGGLVDLHTSAAQCPDVQALKTAESQWTVVVSLCSKTPSSWPNGDVIVSVTNLDVPSTETRTARMTGVMELVNFTGKTGGRLKVSVAPREGGWTVKAVEPRMVKVGDFGSAMIELERAAQVRLSRDPAYPIV